MKFHLFLLFSHISDQINEENNDWSAMNVSVDAAENEQTDNDAVMLFENNQQIVSVLANAINGKQLFMDFI